MNIMQPPNKTPPSITPPPPQIQPAQNSDQVTPRQQPSSNTITIQQQPTQIPQPIITTQAIVVLKPTVVGEQQAPLALTTQPQTKLSIQPTSTLQIQHPQPIKTSTINSQQEPLALITQPQNKTPAVSSPTPQVQPRQPQIVASAPTNVKQESNKHICCLLDQGVRCERIAGNASFSARIQKIVASKKMNFALDPIVRHTYICDHHKAVITVAKKSVPTARESKAAARNLAAAAAAAAANNIGTNSLPTRQMNNFNEMTMNQAAIQHPVDIELMANQGRLANNHAGMLISMPIRHGTQIAYGHYGAGQHSNQVGRMDHNMMSQNRFESVGGDCIPSGSGGVEVDLQQLQVNTLRRYKRHFRVQTRPGLNKMQLAESLKHHFRTLPIIEKEAITYFVYIVKSSRNKLDHNPKAD